MPFEGCRDPIGCSRDGYCSCKKPGPLSVKGPWACACTDAECITKGCIMARAMPLDVIDQNKRYRASIIPRPSAEQGWSCPKCGSVWAPTTPGCFTCNKPSDALARDIVEGVGK